MYQSALRSSYRLHISIDRLRRTRERRTRQKTTLVAIVVVANASNVLLTIGSDVAIEYVQHKDSDIWSLLSSVEDELFLQRFGGLTLQWLQWSVLPFVVSSRSEGLGLALTYADILNMIDPKLSLSDSNWQLLRDNPNALQLHVLINRLATFQRRSPVAVDIDVKCIQSSTHFLLCYVLLNVCLTKVSSGEACYFT